jgi:integrase
MTLSRRTKLTETALAKLRPIGDQQVLFFDTGQPGFGVTVSAGGVRSYFVQRHVHGRTVRAVFRRVGEGTLHEAKKEAARLLLDASNGVDLVAEKRRKREEAEREREPGFTLRSALALTVRTMRTKGRSAATIEDYEANLERYLPDLLDRPVATLTRGELRERHHKLAAQIARGKFKRDKWRKRGAGFGQAAANSTFRALRAVVNRAARDRDDIPAGLFTSVDWFNVERRKAAPGLGTLPGLWQRIAAVDNGIRRDLWRLMLFTGLRRTSACEMRWADVDLGRGLLHVPRPKGGEGRAFDLPLPPYLVGILAARKAEHEKIIAGRKRLRPWVFPAESKSGHIEEPRDDTLGVTPHDCRRLFITVAESTDASPYAIKLLTNHALPAGDVTAGYMALDVERLRPVMETIAARMRALCEPPPAGGNVLPLKRAAR